MNLVNKEVERIINEESNKNHTDFINRYFGMNYPDTNHIALSVPGEFVALQNTDRFSPLGRALYIDGLELIHVEGAVFEESAALIEYLTSPINTKTEKLHEYVISLVANLKKPIYVIVVTNQHDQDETKIIEVDGIPIKLHIRSYNDEKVWEILNRLSEKDYHNDYISELDVICFAYGISFVKGESENSYIEKSVELFTTIENINKDHQRDLYIALKEKIKYLYRNDLTKKREMLTMITKALEETTIMTMPRIEKMAKRIEEQNQVLNEQKNEIQKLKNKIKTLEKK